MTEERVELRTFLLTSAVPAPPDAEMIGRVPAPVGTSGSFGTPREVMPTSYVLEGNDIELANLAGQRVEITGMVLPPPQSTYITPGMPLPSPRGTEDLRRLRVTMVKTISATCTTTG
jgi:hypothetical protein